MNAPGNPGWRYVATLALVAVLILVVGWLIRPRDEAPAPAPATMLSETELVRLSRLAERRSLESMTAYFSDVADDVLPSVAYVRTAGASALVWNDSTVVMAHAGRHFPDTVVLAAQSGDHPSTAIAWGPAVPVAALRRPDTALDLTPVRRRMGGAQPGDWVVAVWRTPQGRAFAMGNALQTTQVRCGSIATDEVLSSLPLVEPMAGGGLFDASGELLGVVLPCEGRLAAVVPAGVDAMLEQAASLEQRLVTRVGLMAKTMSPVEANYFQADGGLLVREVWNGSAADAARLEPGDVLRSLNGSPVTTLEDLAGLAASDGGPWVVGVLRGRQHVDLELPLSGPPAPVETEANADKASRTGLVWEAPGGYPVDRVVPGSPADVAGIRTGDRLLRIGRTAPASLAQVQRLLAGSDAEPVFVELERGRRRLGVLIP